MFADAGGARARRRRRRSPLLKFFFVFSIVLVQYLVLWLISTSLIFKSFELELTFHLKHSVPVTTLLPQLEASIASDGSTTGSEIVSGLSRRSILKSFISCWRRSLLSDSQSSKGCVKFPFSKQIGSYLHLYSTTKALRVGLKIDPPIHLLRRVQSLPVTAPLSHLPAWFFSAPICSMLSRHRESSIVATKGKLGFPLVGWSNFGPLTFSSWPITRSGCPLYICSGPWPARPTNFTKHVELRSQHLELVYRRFLGSSVSIKRQRGMIRSLVSISRCILPNCRGLSSKNVLAWRQVLAKSSPIALDLNERIFSSLHRLTAPQFHGKDHVSSDLLLPSAKLADELVSTTSLCRCRCRSALQLGRTQMCLWKLGSFVSWPIKIGTWKVNGALAIVRWPIYDCSGPLSLMAMHRSVFNYHLVYPNFSLSRHIHTLGRVLLLLCMSPSVKNWSIHQSISLSSSVEERSTHLFSLCLRGQSSSSFGKERMLPSISSATEFVFERSKVLKTLRAMCVVRSPLLAEELDFDLQSIISETFWQKFPVFVYDDYRYSILALICTLMFVASEKLFGKEPPLVS